MANEIKYEFTLEEMKIIAVGLLHYDDYLKEKVSYWGSFGECGEDRKAEYSKKLSSLTELVNKINQV